MRLKQCVEKVSQHSSCYKHDGKHERTYAKHFFILTMNHGKAEHQGRRNANCNGSDYSSRHAKWTRKPGLAEAQNSQGDKFQYQAASINDDVNRDQPLKTQAETHGPSDRTYDNRDPRRSRSWMQFGEELREHAVLRHGQGRSCITHSQRIEHAKCAHHASKHQ